jgi:hypothetical protein
MRLALRILPLLVGGVVAGAVATSHVAVEPVDER